jgi:sulfotransferase
MPRSGSTLLCNILNQNPRFFASNTSPMAQTVRSISGLWSKSPEVKSELINDKEGTTRRMVNSVRALVESWYEGKGEVIFDKGRFWNLNGTILRQLFPDAKMIICVRDLRTIFASVEKQHEKNPMLDEAGNPTEITKYNRAHRMFSPNGLLGQQIMGISDLLHRNLRGPNGKPIVYAIQFESFAQNPQMVMDRIYTALGEEPFEHDFENVQKSYPTDVDGLYNDKYPHEGVGKVQPPDDDWQKYVPADIAKLIMAKFPDYNRTFGYN